MASSNPRFKCPYEGCARIYSTKKILRRHVRAIHEADSQFQCPSCGKFLSSGQNLREHMYIHTGAYPYVCEQPGGGARFRQGSQYCAHKRAHRRSEIDAASRKELVSISLTRLLQKNPTILDSPRSIKVRPASPFSIDLPEIQGAGCLGTIPVAWLYNQLD